ncbi:MAG: type II toxin-antitoxin system VapC family toxin [Solirubrobacteraceae bacterium]
MALLLDAHAVLWWLADDSSLSDGARAAIVAAEEPLLGAGTLVEIAVKRSLGKLELDDDWIEQAQSDGFGVRAIAWPHVDRLQSLPFVHVRGRVHRDPFDRLLAAQALVDSTPVVTCDPALAAYGVSTVW